MRNLAWSFNVKNKLKAIKMNVDLDLKESLKKYFSLGVKPGGILDQSLLL